MFQAPGRAWGAGRALDEAGTGRLQPLGQNSARGLVIFTFSLHPTKMLHELPACAGVGLGRDVGSSVD